MGTMKFPQLAPQLKEAEGLMRGGRWLLILAVLPVLAWLLFAPLASAVVAPAVVKVDLNRRSIQHLEGGTVREVLVRDGDKVKAGQPLMLLGDVAVASEQRRWSARERAERAGVARLEAEQSLLPQIVFDPELLTVAREDPELARILDKERALFSARRQALESQLALLRDQRLQTVAEVESMQAQVQRATEAQELQRRELAQHQDLQKQGFVSSLRVSQLEAQMADYAVKLEERRSELARAQQKRFDVDLRARGLSNEYRQGASEQLKAALVRLGEVQQEQRRTGDAAGRQRIVAPVDGEVMGLTVQTAGAVLTPRQVVAEIVPTQRELIVEAMVRPEDADRVSLGQVAEVRLSSQLHAREPLLKGKVRYLSADRLVEQRSGMPYYAAQIVVDPASLESIGMSSLQAGMAAEVYLLGNSRSPLRYMFEPLTRFGQRAAREH
jgi:HlyD family secretion protein